MVLLWFYMVLSYIDDVRRCKWSQRDTSYSCRPLLAFSLNCKILRYGGCQRCSICMGKRLQRNGSRIQILILGKVPFSGRLACHLHTPASFFS
jgi:hypothetical protein